MTFVDFQMKNTLNNLKFVAVINWYFISESSSSKWPGGQIMERREITKPSKWPLLNELYVEVRYSSKYEDFLLIMSEIKEIRTTKSVKIRPLVNQREQHLCSGSKIIFFRLQIGLLSGEICYSPKSYFTPHRLTLLSADSNYSTKTHFILRRHISTSVWHILTFLNIF